MLDFVKAKLSLSGALREQDFPLLQTFAEGTRRVPAHQDLLSEGDRPENLHAVHQGFACRYKIGLDGRRNIMALLVPGDLCDLHVAILGRMDHSVGTITDCSIAEVSRTKVVALTDNAGIARALWWATLVDEAILREWLVNLGGREGNRRIAHLFCELRLRLSSVGLAANGSYDFPVTQTDLGDIIGLSNVHVNRTLRELRELDLVHFERGKVHIPNVAELEVYSDFDANYLHLMPRIEARKQFALAMTSSTIAPDRRLQQKPPQVAGWA